MSDELLIYYNRELAFMRQMGAEFASAYPKIAGRLRLGADGPEDPHVSRLIEAFAFLNARTRMRVEDDFPEVSEALLGTLYPHYLAPVPSMAVVQFALDQGQADLAGGLAVPVGSALESDPIDGVPCRFTTCYPVTVWPIQVEAAELSGPPFPFLPAGNPPPPHTVAVLRLVLGLMSSGLSLSAVPIDELRFFLKAPAQQVYPLYEAILGNTLGVVATSSPDSQPVVLGRDCIQPVGFAGAEAALPYPARSPLGYRLLTEFFAFPEKFLFFDVTGLRSVMKSVQGRRLELYLFLGRGSPDLQRSVTADNFRLGCTPVVNLFRQRAEPTGLSHTEPEYRVVPDARHPDGAEVYSVNRVTATSPAGDVAEFVPFYAGDHRGLAPQRRYWYAARRPAGRTVDRGTDVFLSLVDLDLNAAAPADWTLDVETTCLNRDLPARLPFGGNEPRLSFSDGGGALAPVVCLTPPTRTQRAHLRRGATWRLISHLTLNHLSLVGEEEGAKALSEILTLYNVADSMDTRAMIEGIAGVSSHRVTGRVRGSPRSAFTRGVEVTVHLDQRRFPGGSVYLFATVLERFLGLWCSVNTFTRLTVLPTRQEGASYQWPPRNGETPLV